MGACLSFQKREDSNPHIIDIEDTVADAAWCMFYDSLSRWQRLCLRRKDFTVEVPMNYFHFQVTDEKLFRVENDKKDNKKPDDKNGNRGAEQKARSDLERRELAHKTETSPEHVGLEVEFKNSTSEKQTYNFKCEKTRKSTMTVSFQKGFTVGGKANFSLGLPKMLPDGKASTEIDMRVSVTKTTGETFEQTLTTSATSDITVAAHSHYTATVDMEERQLLADFKVWVRVSLPVEEARAFIKNKAGDTIYFFTHRHLPDLFPNSTHLEDENGDTRSDAVEFVIEGRVNGMQMSSHRINLVDHKADSHAQTQTQSQGSSGGAGGGSEGQKS
ncbi:uncharacterized protein LOC143289015 [Babylonia areolata]|uniref:uncharacterized protein LOC143289015 n=1 Tax=Babylonia areolata TaxID=304850 RepID=UPI003FD110C1